MSSNPDPLNRLLPTVTWEEIFYYGYEYRHIYSPEFMRDHQVMIEQFASGTYTADLNDPKPASEKPSPSGK